MEVPTHIPAIIITGPTQITDVLIGCLLATSRGEAKRLISQGGVEITQKNYRLGRYNDKLMGRPDGPRGMSQKVKGANFLITDGDIIKVGHKFFLFALEGTPEEWSETYGIREQMIAIWGEEKGLRQLGET